MRIKSKILVFVLASLLFACDEKIDPNPNLLGTWIWVRSTGGIAGKTETSASTGQQIIIEFSKSRFKKYVEGKLIDDLQYVIKLDDSIFSTEKVDIISYGNNMKQSFIVTTQSLLLNDECYDCYQYEYKKE